MSEHVAVVACTRNRGRLLQATLRSISRQDLTNVEVIVMDDGSTDGTDVMVEEFSWLDYRYVPRPDDMKGWQEAGIRLYNPAIEALPPNTIVIVQSAEVIHHTDCIREVSETLVKLEQETGKEVAVFATCVNAPLEAYPDIINCAGKWLSHAPQLFCGVGRQTLQFFLGAVRREVWVGVGGFPSGYHSDVTLATKLKARGVLFHFHPTSLCYHCAHDKEILYGGGPVIL